MENKFLLYIDILGFSNLIEKNSHLVRNLYNLIDNLNAHNHDAFKVIVFSDTILIYNIEEALNINEAKYYVMFLVEFAQNLFYQFAGKRFFFRAVLTYGEFEHNNPQKVERFWGKALVTAYQMEKQIDSTGLFIDKYCNKYNYFFSEPFNENLSFIYYTQSLEELILDWNGDLPIQAEYLIDSDIVPHLIKELVFLRDVFTIMRKHEDPKVRSKMLTTWDFYKRRYSKILTQLELADFDFKIVSNDCNWKRYEKEMLNGYRGHGIKPKSESKFIKIINKARKIGDKIADCEFHKIYGKRGYNPPYLPAGFAHIILDVDTFSTFGKFLLKNDWKEYNFKVYTTEDDSGIYLSICNEKSYQEKCIAEKVEEGMLKYLEKELEIEGHIESCYD
jgi:hypothetical protein